MFYKNYLTCNINSKQTIFDELSTKNWDGNK